MTKMGDGQLFIGGIEFKSSCANDRTIPYSAPELNFDFTISMEALKELNSFLEKPNFTKNLGADIDKV